MAPEPSQAQAAAPWTKIFTAFQVALDMKKLVLAAAGIFLASLGWWAIGWTFSAVRGAAPEWKNFENKDKPEERSAQWSRFKARRASWNLLHELAGSPSDHRKQDAADVTDDVDEFELLHKWDEAYQRYSKPLTLKEKTLKVPDLGSDVVFELTPSGADAEAAFAKLKDRSLTVGSLQLLPPIPIAKDKDGKESESPKVLMIDGVMVKVDGQFEKLKEYREGALTALQVAEQARREKNQKLAQQALKTFNTRLVNAKVKPSGQLNVCPWSEERGGNPYLIVADTLKTRDVAGTGNSLLHWVLSDKVLVLLEPLVKFLTPLVYLFDARAGFMDRLYLILIILWTLAVWGFFGGAICRIAAVQIAKNERISLTEALTFTRERFASYVAAPVFPLVLLAIFVFILMIFGWIEWIPWVGDIFAGIFWPVVIVIGFIMAIVMVGLVGWPLMIATISTEGTDSFDALSRSYSYIYQAPWQYLWYNFLAVVYGAALVFFIGFMASLMVFLGKWGVSSAVGLSTSDPKTDREPSYLFYYAPTSYGWRDLLISSNTQFVETRTIITPGGQEVKRKEFRPEYEKEITGMNTFGAILVAAWIYPLFLLVLGFSYSFFWSSSTLIYFLMRHHVDDTEMDEVHQEDDDLDDPFLKATTAPSAPPAAAPKPGAMSLNVVDAPPPAPPPYTAPEPPPPPAPEAPPSSDTSSSPPASDAPPSS